MAKVDRDGEVLFGKLTVQPSDRARSVHNR